MRVLKENVCNLIEGTGNCEYAGRPYDCEHRTYCLGVKMLTKFIGYKMKMIRKFTEATKEK